MKGLFTYDMIRDIWIPLLSGIIGGLFTLVGVVLTVRYERKKSKEITWKNKTLSRCSALIRPF